MTQAVSALCPGFALGVPVQGEAVPGPTHLHRWERASVHYPVRLPTS